MIWAVIYIAGVGISVLPVMAWLERQMPPKPDEMDRAVIIFFSLTIALTWFVFVPIGLLAALAHQPKP